MPEQMKELKIVDASGKVIFHVDGKGKALIKDEDGKLYAVFQPSMLLLYDIISNHRNKLSISINASAHMLGLNNETCSKTTVLLDGKNSAMRLLEKDGKDTVWLDGNQANIWLGGNNRDGDILLFPSRTDVGNYKNVDAASSTIHLDGESGDIKLSGADDEGNMKNKIRLDAKGGNVYLGGYGADGDLVIFPSSGDNKSLDQATIHLDGESGDIKLRNADCAEDFEVIDSQDVEPGSVMVIEQEGKLRQSTVAYDKRVAGVISGAGGIKPGIILGRDPSNGKAMPIALSGKVYCKADAGQSPIQVGDLLTTSNVPGHAMKATNHDKAFGTIIGKALQSHEKGRDLIPILVALQ